MTAKDHTGYLQYSFSYLEWYEIGGGWGGPIYFKLRNLIQSY